MGFLKRFFSIGRKKRRERMTASHLSQAHDPDETLHPLKIDVDSEATASQLLRSSSLHFNIVNEEDYDAMKPISHPINSVSSRSTAILSPSRPPSIKTKRSYTVRVLKRQQLSSTEFPNAYPPLTPHRPGAKSTPNLHETLSMPGRRRQTSDPRKVPITPRDVNRLIRLRQDPSVASLLSMYDDKGQLDDKAFSNTPPPPSALTRKCWRESTFRELLGGKDLLEADLSWAERCIANGSTSTLSTVPSPTLDSPNTASFTESENNHEDRTHLTTSSDIHQVISSMIVEPSLASDENGLNSLDQTGPSMMVEAEPKASKTASHRIVRSPSQRASQVFDFLAEKRERRRSRSLGSEEFTGLNAAEERLLPFVKSLSVDHQAAVPDSTSPVTFRPLDPAPRTRARSTGAAETLRLNAFGRENEWERQMKWEHNPWWWYPLHTSTPPVKSRNSCKAPASKGPGRKNPGGSAFSVLTNEITEADEVWLDADTPKAVHPECARVEPSVSVVNNNTSHDKRYDTFVANLHGERKQGKENGRPRNRVGQLNLARVATMSRFISLSKAPPAPLANTPTRSRSLFDTPSPASSSELSPEAMQIMNAIRKRKVRARKMQRSRESQA